MLFVPSDHVTGTGELKKRFPNLKSGIAAAANAKADVFFKPQEVFNIGQHTFKVRQREVAPVCTLLHLEENPMPHTPLRRCCPLPATPPGASVSTRPAAAAWCSPVTHCWFEAAAALTSREAAQRCCTAACTTSCLHFRRPHLCIQRTTTRCVAGCCMARVVSSWSCGCSGHCRS